MSNVLIPLGGAGGKNRGTTAVLETAHLLLTPVQK